MGRHTEIGFIPERDVYEASRRLYGYLKKEIIPTELDITDDPV